MTYQNHPLQSLRKGRWFKLICGASFQHLPAVRNLVLAYALAGADCIDVAADPAVVLAAQDGLKAAAGLMGEAQNRGFGIQELPWLMVSLNDGDDPHFRKADFNPAHCPPDCSRPCERICPAGAIAPLPLNSLNGSANDFSSGVIRDRCYGCGRCLPVCPIQTISTYSYVSAPQAIAPLVLQMGVEAVEIHTQVGRLDDFQRLWQAIAPWTNQLQLIAISCPDSDDLLDYLWALYDLISPLPCPLIWQTDGRPMSGDIGIGTTKAAIKLGQKVLQGGPPGYVQLAGGTNYHTVPKLRSLGLLKSATPSPRSPSTSSQIAGVAYGSYARMLLSPILDTLETDAIDLETIAPSLLWDAVHLAHTLVSQLKPSPTLTAPSAPSIAP